MKKIEIEKDIPCPRKTRGRDVIYRFDEMAIGDSFFVEGDSKIQVSVLTCARRKRPKKFVTQRDTKDGVEGYRCWRRR